MKQRLIDFILNARGDFKTLALDLFAYQYTRNGPFRQYCDSLGASPDRIDDWRAIPTVPTDVFRVAPLFCGQPEEAVATFQTSGTTSGQRGQHMLRTLEVYHASARQSIARYLLPDAAPRPALMLAPPPHRQPDSSLSSMLGLIAAEHTQDNALYAWNNARLNEAAAILWIDDAQRAAEPVQILGTSFALVQLFDTLAKDNRHFSLPPGSILMPTGGTKGRIREVSPEDLEVEAHNRLGIAIDHIVQEYGMTELGSQLYDPRLALSLQGHPAPTQRLLASPPWCRITVHDPLTLAPLPEGEIGLLRFTDLANLDSVCSVQTSDRGVLVTASQEGDQIVLLGRAPGATPRGCSLLVEETWTL